MWVKLDDNFPDNPKVMALSAEAFRLYVEALCFCGRNLTDGMLSKAALRRLAHPETADELVVVGLWFESEEGYEVKDFLAYNPTKVQVEAKRTSAKRRKELHSDPALVKAIRARDGNRCRYCAGVVSWKDRRGPSGATYDHVDPKGDNSLENVVVACRACNSSKGSRTPEQALMPMLPPPNQIGPSSVTGTDPATRPDPTRPDLSPKEREVGVSADDPPTSHDPRANLTPLRAVRDQLREATA